MSGSVEAHEIERGDVITIPDEEGHWTVTEVVSIHPNNGPALWYHITARHDDDTYKMRVDPHDYIWRVSTAAKV